MKTKILCAALMLVITLTAFKTVNDKSIATVEQKDGYYIFIHSKPKEAYETIGTVKKKGALSGEPTEMLEGIIKKVKKEYPKADGIIFISNDMGEAEAIKFKE